MKAVSRGTCLGAAIFAAAAVVAALTAMEIHGIPNPGRTPSEALWFRVLFPLAAGISAALAFAAVRLFDWRLRSEPLLGRALTLGCSTVAVGHLLIGIVAAGLVQLESLVFPGSPSETFGSLLFTVLGMSAFSVVFGWYLTLPLGVSAAALLEWLERRREAASEPKAGG